ncbi:MAG: molybdopterin-dependent oxidoreductase, partial [Planctomycetota bacterium]|nr:molybdopterin-dependent oxidoreductase [Planctomycetota bacterium]
MDPVGWSMRIEGLVEQPISLTLDDLLVLDMLDATITIACVSNTVGGSLVG